jgi:hypothetical protein
MSERKWITREEIADIYEERALKEAHEGDDIFEALRIAKQAGGIREIESIYSPNLNEHIHMTRAANQGGRTYAR